MNGPAIRVERLSKYYRIGVHGNTSLRQSLARGWRAVTRRNVSMQRSRTGFWALKEISFDVAPGEIVGVIGRNGAGKSTLLKILSRTVSPTKGRVELHGRVGSLLEVGTGFHPELTGRENIYLNGAILGMQRVEIDQEFDRIVDFAEVETFLDTPVKRYSSGMYVRLAFAVAAHLRSDILIVDEVLAVGDAAFQRRCIGRMEGVASEGRTVLFVSHNMSSVAALCNRAILLDHGRLAADGRVADVAARYQSAVYTDAADPSDLSIARHTGSGKAMFTSMVMTPQGADGSRQPVLWSGDDLVVDLRIDAYADVEQANVCLIIYDAIGYRLIDVNTAQRGEFVRLRAGESAQVRFHLQNVLLKPDEYTVGLWIGRGGFEDIDHIEQAARLMVEVAPERVRHSETFPGPYQCQYTHVVQYLPDATSYGERTGEENYLREGDSVPVA